MTADDLPTAELWAEVCRFVEALADADEERRTAAAWDLVRLGVRDRGSVRRRGDSTRTAEARLPKDFLDRIVQCLDDPNPDVREAVAVALGEWGGSEELSQLARRATPTGEGDGAESEERVLMAYVVAFRTLGGEDAVDALTQLASRPTQPRSLKLALVVALHEIGAPHGPDITEPPAPPRGPIPTAARGSLAVLQAIASDQGEPFCVRQKARDALAHLG